MTIVSDDHTIGGRWRISGTRLPVMLLRSHPRDWLLANYPGVTDAMVTEALEWDFPPIPGRAAYPVAKGVGAECVCGESAGLRYVATTGPVNIESAEGDHEFVCPACGRKYVVSIALRAVE